MNQAIQIYDGFVYEHSKNAIQIDAVCGGQLITCFITDVSESEAARLYEQWQFDIEEVLIDKIEQEDWDEFGQVVVSKARFA